MRALVLALLLAACTDGATPAPRPDAAPRPARKIKPPPDESRVRVFPPYAIRSDGVGPYLLDAPLADILRLVPEGPRSEVLDVGEAVSWRLVRAEEGRLLIGADARGRVGFMVVLSADVARTDLGLTVGMTGAGLEAAMGPARRRADLVRSRRAYEFDKLPNVVFLSDAGAGRADADARIVAVLVERPRDTGEKTAARPNACRAGGALAEVPPADLVAASRGNRPRVDSSAAKPPVVFGCFTGGDPEALLAGDGELVLVGGPPGKLRRLAAAPLASADVLGALDLDGDGRDEIVAMSEQRSENAVSIQVDAWSWESNKLVRLAGSKPLVLTRDALATAAATPATANLWAEVRRDGGDLTVGGLYAARGVSGLRDVAPLTPVRLRLEARRGPAASPADAGADAQVKKPAIDAGAAGEAPTP